MPTPKKKLTKRPPKKAVEKAALIKFAALQKGSVRMKADNPKSAWLEFGPLWLKSNTKGVSNKTKLAAIKALKRFKKR